MILRRFNSVHLSTIAVSIFLLSALVLRCTKSKEPHNLNRLTPVIASEWIRIADYPGNHLNDFCIFQDKNGIWHSIGIMGTGTWESEQSLYHCSSEDLSTTFEIHDPILTENPPGELAPQKHAPHVIYHKSEYHLFYRRPPGTILHTRTVDPYEWNDLGDFVFEENDARDVCIVKVDDTFYMYYCQYFIHESVPRSGIFLRRSKDLYKWSEAVTVHIDTQKPKTHSYLECPFVVKRPEGYYLFIHHGLFEDCTTVVLFSKKPDKFPSGEKQWFAELDKVHAAEIVQYNGDYYIARISGAPHAHATKFAPKNGGWIEIAKLEFR